VAAPEVLYARADDGTAIAYSITGNGPVALVLVFPMTGQVEMVWEEPAWASFVRRLATCTTVILFDRRGTGLSDRSTASGDRLALPQLASDIEAVLDAAGVKQVVLFGVTFGCLLAVQFAAEYPSRTQALILAGGFAKLRRLREYDFEVHPERVDEWADRTAREWGNGAFIARHAPDMADSATYHRWAARMERHTCSPGMVAAMCRSAARWDVREMLADVQAPTLVLQRTNDRTIPIEEGRYLAEHIPEAELLELPGDNHVIVVGDQRSTVDAMIRFVDRRVSNGALKALRRAERKDSATFGWDGLSPSEREIAHLVADGLTNREVASRLGMSAFTVDGRLRRVFSKLAVKSRVELAAVVARERS
jgi:pimeloyl-ACP methyl ester carboxylesterase/DNA-binding CsgD family transcriptional regulator